MCNFTCNSNTEHSNDGLFMYVTHESVDKYPNLFGGGKASSEPKDETISFTSKEQEIVATKPKIPPDDMDLGDKREKIRHKFVKELSQLNLLLRHQDTL